MLPASRSSKALLALPLLALGVSAGFLFTASCGSEPHDPVWRETGPAIPLDPLPDAGSPDSRPVLPDANVGFGACKENPGWVAGHPLGTCTLQLAPPEHLADAMLPMRPCNNGQANCTEMALFGDPYGVPHVLVRPIDPEVDGFFLQLDYAGAGESCRRAMKIVPTGSTYLVGGAADMDLRRPCGATPERAGMDLAIAGDPGTDAVPRPTAVVLTPWTSYSPSVQVDVRTKYPWTLRSQNTLFAFEGSTGSYDIIDIAANRLLTTVHPPANLRQFGAEFATHGELWGTATYGELGKSEAWRLDASGKFWPLIQKQGVNIFATRTDNTTIFWVEGSGNDADLMDQPKLEIWSAPFSTDPATISRTKRMVLDISGAKSAMDGAAHAGYFVVNLGNAGIAIVRGRDGATQRYTLGGDWGYFLPAYVDETQIWFEHAATRAQSAGVARLALDPWP